MSNSSLEHYKYLNFIFSYLLKTSNYSLDLTLQSLESNNSNNNTINNINNSINLLGISNLDQGGDLDSRKSTIGNIFILNNSKSNYNNNIAISQILKLQKTIAISSVEAEYIALKEATKESLYLNNFIKDFFNNNSIKEFSSIFNRTNIIKIDSLSAIELAKNLISYARTKHVDITYYFIRENLLDNKINLVYKNTSTILVDNLTKPTSYSKFKDFINRISLVKLD